MQALRGKRVLLGIGGGIAAYKAAELIRLLRGAGAEVRVVLTQAASQFVTPLTLQALSGQPVRQSLFDTEQEAAMGHIELARWADLVLIAPATADLMARLAAGLADDLLTTLVLATGAPVALAPAMNTHMWRHPATQANAATLAERRALLWGPGEGELACGETGPGRMLEPAQLIAKVRDMFGPRLLEGVRVLVTAGPTREVIDPVRYVGNRSSGKMGYALAAAFAEQGALVTLVSGPVALPCPAGMQRVMVESALEMERAVMERVAECDLFAACAAVADYRPASPAEQKIKKGRETLDITLVRNPDILAQVAALERPPFTLGFAAETERVEEFAEAKRLAKKVKMIAANRVGATEGFERDDNALTVLWEGGRCDLPSTSKRELAKSLVALAAERYHAQD